MIRQKLAVNAKLVSELNGYYDSFESIAREEFDAVWRGIEPLLRDELETQPRRRIWPGDYPGRRLEWTSEKQRRWYWANVGHPYQRTGRLAKSWRTSASYAGGRVTIIVENPAKSAQYVYGSLAKTNPGRFQQRFHAITGWEPMYKTVNYWLDAAYEDYQTALYNRLSDLISGTTTTRRAYTAGTRRRRR